MAAASKTPVSEKRSVCKKIVSLLGKRYSRAQAKREHDVLQTILYGVCLENSSVETADVAFEKLQTEFYDLNEARVSSITELEQSLSACTDPEWRALRIRSVLHHTFETHYAFDFELLRRKTLELAQQELRAIPSLTDFVCAHTLQVVLGAHVLPVDDVSYRALVWLGLVESDVPRDEAGSTLKPVVRKADVPLVMALIRRFATDPALKRTLAAADKATEFDLSTAGDRLQEAFQDADTRGKKPASKTKPPTSKARKKTASATPKQTTARKKKKTRASKR